MQWPSRATVLILTKVIAINFWLLCSDFCKCNVCHLITSRKRSLGEGNILSVSVILSTGGGVRDRVRDMCGRGRVHGRGACV